MRAVAQRTIITIRAGLGLRKSDFAAAPHGVGEALLPVLKEVSMPAKGPFRSDAIGLGSAL